MRSSIRLMLASLTLASLCVLVPSIVAPRVARAQEGGCDESSEENQAKKSGKNFHVEIKNGQKVHVIDTVVTVCGKVPRPSVVYVLQAKSINYEWENLKQDFLPRTLKSVESSPF
jgi:hypothetical protein